MHFNKLISFIMALLLLTGLDILTSTVEAKDDKVSSETKLHQKGIHTIRAKVNFVFKDRIVADDLPLRLPPKAGTFSPGDEVEIVIDNKNEIKKIKKINSTHNEGLNLKNRGYIRSTKGKWKNY